MCCEEDENIDEVSTPEMKILMNAHQFKINPLLENKGSALNGKAFTADNLSQPPEL